MKIKLLLSTLLAGALTLGITSCDKKGHGNADSASAASDSVAASASAVSTGTSDAISSEDPGEQLIALMEQASISIQNANSKEEIQSILTEMQGKASQIVSQNPGYKPTPEVDARGKKASDNLADALMVRTAELGIDMGDLE